MKLAIFLVICGVIAVLYAMPAFYLKSGAGKDKPEDVTRYLGEPLQSVDEVGGTTVSIYKVEKVPPICVQYVVTFKKQITGGDDPSLQTLGVQSFLKDWTWRWCPSDKK